MRPAGIRKDSLWQHGQRRAVRTYAIKGKRGSGEIILNGAVAHLGKKGDLLTIMNFAGVSKKKAKNWKPRVIVLGRKNRVETVKRGV